MINVNVVMIAQFMMYANANINWSSVLACILDNHRDSLTLHIMIHLKSNIHGYTKY